MGNNIATGPRTLCEAFQYTAATNPNTVALRTPDDSVALTWRQYAERVRRITAGLAALGVRKGETVGTMLTNRPEFHLVDTAALHVGATPFSVYNTLAAEQLNYVLTNAGNRVMICEKQFLPVVREAAEGTSVERIVCVDGAVDGAMSLEELESLGDPNFDFEARWKSVEPDDLLTIIYTSGTTGPPQGRGAHTLESARATDHRPRGCRKPPPRQVHLLPPGRTHRKPLDQSLPRHHQRRPGHHADRHQAGGHGAT